MEMSIVLLPIESVRPNPWNPNLMFEAERHRLKECMAASGPTLTPPILVRRRDGYYEIIDGEQRWLAARELGWTHIPAIIRDLPDAEAKKLTLSLNYLKGRMNYVKLARWIRDKKDMEMLRAFRMIFGEKMYEVLTGLMRLPEDILNAIEDAIQQGIEVTMSKIEPVTKASEPWNVLATVLTSEKYSKDLAFYEAAHGIEAAVKSVAEKEKMDSEWRMRKLESARREEEEKRRKIEEERRREGSEVSEGEVEGKDESKVAEEGKTAFGLMVEGSEKYILPPEHAEQLLELTPEEALERVRGFEALAERAIYYECACCGAIHALLYKQGQLEAYLVKRGGEFSESYERMQKEVMSRVYVCPNCSLKFTVDYESGRATPLPGEGEREEAGQNQP